ncbi:4276_t:CDS:2, partial [Ambispora leptoticha]
LVNMLFSLGIHDKEKLPDSMIVDDEQSIGNNRERDSERENMNTAENTASIEVDSREITLFLT